MKKKMESNKEHHELMTRIAVFEATVAGKFDSIITHLSSLNGQTSKNTGAIQQLQLQDKDIMTMLYARNKEDRDREIEQNEREDQRNKKIDGWKKRWQDLLFGSLQWILPAIIIGILLNGKKIVEFLNLTQ